MNFIFKWSSSAKCCFLPPENKINIVKPPSKFSFYFTDKSVFAGIGVNDTLTSEDESRVAFTICLLLLVKNKVQWNPDITKC